jgi:hypothetical protein
MDDEDSDATVIFDYGDDDNGATEEGVLQGLNDGINNSNSEEEHDEENDRLSFGFILTDWTYFPADVPPFYCLPPRHSLWLGSISRMAGASPCLFPVNKCTTRMGTERCLSLTRLSQTTC